MITQKRSALIPVFLTAFLAVLVTLLTPGNAEASVALHSGSPCPNYALSDVYADPDGDWDHDRLSNRDEIFYATLNPCIKDASTYCSQTHTSWRCLPEYKKTHHGSYYVNYHYAYGCTSSGHWYWSSVNYHPHGDWDGDGISNYTEAAKGANPCAKPCPHAKSIDIALNPHADWDGDHRTNATEQAHRTDPCSANSFNPCPHYSHHHVNLMPSADWDGDGVHNRNEVYYGSNPCVAGSVRLPHVVHVAPTPPPVIHTITPGYQCPYGYPYYHPGNGLCYANPIGGY